MKNTTLSIIAVAMLFPGCSKSPKKTPGTTTTTTTSLSTKFPGIDTASFYPSDGLISGAISLKTSYAPIRISSSGKIDIPAQSNFQDTISAVTYNIVISDTTKSTGNSTDSWWYYVDIRQPGVDTLIVNGTLGWTKTPTGQTFYTLNIGGSIKHVIQSSLTYAKW